MENTQTTKIEGSFVDQAASEREIKDTTNTSSTSAAKSPRRKRRRLAGW